MERDTLANFYWPITVDHYEDDYYEKILVAVNESFNDQSFDWYIQCIRAFMFNEIDNELKDSLINIFASANSSFVMIENDAHLMVLAQAVIYNQIFYASDKSLAKRLSMAINCMAFCYNKVIHKLPNLFYVNAMKEFVFNEFIDENQRHRVDFSAYQTIDNDSIPSNELENLQNNIPVFIQQLNLLEVKNKILTWIVLEKSLHTAANFKDMPCEDAAFNIGFDLGTIVSQTPVPYPQAYIAKALNDISKANKFFEEKKELRSIIEKIKIDLLDDSLEINQLTHPLSYAIIQHKCKNKEYLSTMNMRAEITLLDFAIQIFCEKVLIEMAQ
jgi:hypothetical protein